MNDKLFYLTSEDSIKLYPANSGHEFTCQLSQMFPTPTHMLGLVEISFEVSKDVRKLANRDAMLHIMVDVCRDCEVGSHKHPVLRQVSLREYLLKSTPILRFPNVLYLPIRQDYMNSITVSVRLADKCCSSARLASDLNISGVTRCTFRMKEA